MNNLQLSDLDELSMLVRNSISRMYIKEAIDAYKGGAFRAAIVSTWIAVSYDIIAKIRELSEHGDKQAIKFIESLNKLIESKDIPGLQKVENNLLNIAENEFEFLTVHESADIKRLKEDRNLSAHPAFVSEDSLFQPIPELVRVHIVHSVAHLLRHPPLQGKSAIERVVRDINRLSFPNDPKEIDHFFNDKYLSKAKKVFITNLIKILIKIVFQENELEGNDIQHKAVYSLQSVLLKHSEIFKVTVKSFLPKFLESLDDHQFHYFIYLLNADQRYWSWIDESNRVRTKAYLKSIATNSNSAKFSSISFDNQLFKIEDLKNLLLEIFESLHPNAQERVIKDNPVKELAYKAIDLYSQVNGFRNAERLGNSVILPMAPNFSSNDVKVILESVIANQQIRYAGGSPEIIQKFFDLTLNLLDDTKEYWNTFAKALIEQNIETSEYYVYPELQQILRDREIIDW